MRISVLGRPEGIQTDGHRGLTPFGSRDLPRISEVATGMEAPTMKRFLPICRRFRSLSSRERAMVVTCSWALRPLRVTPPTFDR